MVLHPVAHVGGFHQQVDPAESSSFARTVFQPDRSRSRAAPSRRKSVTDAFDAGPVPSRAERPYGLHVAVRGSRTCSDLAIGLVTADRQPSCCGGASTSRSGMRVRDAPFYAKTLVHHPADEPRRRVQVSISWSGASSRQRAAMSASSSSRSLKWARRRTDGVFDSSRGHTRVIRQRTDLDATPISSSRC